ncbi:MAG: MATE family efflux transporter, partial [Muribaculaceae bacterium]|nr:MATE family efflux transporter [Muribaculaceae bacterium]
IYSIGMSPFLMNVCACVVVVFINKALLDYGGDDGNLAIGAYGIMNRTAMFFVMIVFGVTQGMQPILGYNYGAGKINRVNSTLNKGIMLGVIITFVGWVITMLAPGTVNRLFTTDEGLIRLADEGFHIYFICFPVVGCQIVIQNFFQSVGKPKISIFLSLTRQLIFLLPMLWILPRYFGVNGVWASMSSSDIIACIIAIVTLVVTKRHQNKTLNRQSA